MDLEEWKIKHNGRRSYAHFDSKVSLDEVWKYISNPQNVSKHGFYPFIHYTLKFEKYNKSEGKALKEREICYSAHIDRLIFQVYGFYLNQIYNAKADKEGISDVAIAYRDNLGKNNIHFAKQAIDFIRKTECSYIIVGDFTKFFDRLDHKYLKKMLKLLLNSDELPLDYYAVYKNITKYSMWDMESILMLNGLPNSVDGIKKLNGLTRVLPLEKFRIYKNQYVKRHGEDFGIPQGSAISAILSNIYMLDFDKNLKDYVLDNKGLYMRYSDDFIIVLPKRNDKEFKKQYEYISGIINSTPRLELQQGKTKVFEYNDRTLISCNELVLSGVNNGINLLNYLGFTFDGKVVTIRDKTVTKYHYRMYRKLKTIVKNKGYSPKGKRISCKNLYEKYSIKGSNTGKGNFITYVQRAETIFGKNEAINRGTKNHMQKIRRKLNLIKS